MVWAYQRTLLEGDDKVKVMSEIHQGEWINLWLLADLLGAPRLQNNVILCLEEYRHQKLLKPLKGSFLQQIYEATTTCSALRRYLVDTWDNVLQVDDVSTYPSALLVALVNANRTSIKNEDGILQVDPRQYFVDDRIQQHIPFIYDLPDIEATLQPHVVIPPKRKAPATVADDEAKTVKKKKNSKTIKAEEEDEDDVPVPVPIPGADYMPLLPGYIPPGQDKKKKKKSGGNKDGAGGKGKKKFGTKHNQN